MRAHFEREAVLFVLLLLLLNIIALAPVLARHLYYSSSMIGHRPYYFCRISGQIAEKQVCSYDLVQGRPLMATLPDFISALFISFLGRQACQLVPYLFSIVSFLLFYYLLRKSGIKNEVRILSLLIWVISPAFVYNATVFNPHNIGVALFLLTLIFLTMGNRLTYVFGVGLLLLMNGFVSLFNFLLGIGVALSFVITRRDTKLIFILALVIFPLSLYYGKSAIFMRYGSAFDGLDSVQALFTDLGATIGFGTFDLFLVLAGLVSIWLIYSRFKRIFLLIFIIMALLFTFPEAFVIYANMGIAVLAATGLIALWKREWKIPLLRGLTLLLIGCGLIFTSLSYMNRLSNSSPTIAEIEALDYLRRIPDGTVLSEKENGFFIEGIGEKKAFLDETNYVSSETLDRVADRIFYSLNLEQTMAILDAHNIRYILIDDKMRKGGIWSRPDEGLLFLIERSETFNKIYDSLGIEIWEYKRE